jgi:uncharacterized RDD family membrane protein YckC
MEHMSPILPSEQQVIATEVVYAGFWRRFFAVILDCVITGAADTILALIILLGASLGKDSGFAAIILMYATNILGAWLYFTLMESSKYQATIGKMALGIRVTDLNGNRASWGRVNARYFASFLSGITLGIGFIMAGFTQKKQAMHDMIAGTLVLGQQPSVPANIAQNAFQS